MTIKAFFSIFMCAVGIQNHDLCMHDALELEQARRRLEAIADQYPLIEAVEQNNLEKVRQLLAAGVDVNTQGYGGKTPLYRAVKKGYKEIAELLLHHNASMAAQYSHGDTLLHIAARSGHKDIAKLLIQYQANVNAQNYYGRTPLHRATYGGHKELVELLLHHKASVDDQNDDGETPLHIAAIRDQAKIAELFIKHNASIFTLTKHGDTPLHYAAYPGQPQLFKTLLFSRSGLAQGVTLKKLCLNFLSSHQLTQEHLETLPEYIQNDIQEGPKKELVFIQQALTIKNNHGEAARDIATERKHNDIATLIDVVLKAKTPDDLKALDHK